MGNILAVFFEISIDEFKIYCYTIFAQNDVTSG